MKGAVGILVGLAGFASCFGYMVHCEGEWSGRAWEEGKSAELAGIRKELESDVARMQGMGPRHTATEVAYGRLRECEDWVRRRWEEQGHAVAAHRFSCDGRDIANLEIEFAGRLRPSEIVVISAQYDTLPDSPGANNNASGMAVLFALGRLLRGHPPNRTLRLVAFVNEEDPHYGTDKMGSYHYARDSWSRGEDIRAMVSLDSLGIYSDRPGSQRIPFPFSLAYPDRGNFLAFIGDLGSRPQIVEATRGFKKGSAFPIRAAAVPGWVKGAGWSDHGSFWRFGYPGMQVTDTGAFRSESHTTREDTMEKLDFGALSRIVLGMRSAVLELAQAEEEPSRGACAGRWGRALLTHGSGVLLAGLLAGFAYRRSLVRNASAERIAQWRVAHAFLAAEGIFMLVVGLATPQLALDRTTLGALGWSLIVSGYGFAVAFLIGAWKGKRGLSPRPLGLDTLLFAGHSVGALGSLVVVVLVLIGAWAHRP